MYTLLKPNVVIPGEYRYEQTEGIQRKWGKNPDLDQLARFVSDFRKGNGLARDSVPEAYHDIVQFNAVRLGGNPLWFNNSDAAMPVPRSVKGCAGCGAQIT